MKNRILIVDDHEIVRAGIRNVLGTRFTICGEASSGEEAIAKTIELKPDVVVLDIVMPKMNGLAAARQIRSISPTTKILLLSLLDCSETETEARAVGADAYLPKTCPPHELLGVVEKLLSQSK